MSDEPDEVWTRGDTGERYWRPSTAHEPRTTWVGPHDGAQPAQDDPGPPPVVEAVRSAVDRIRQALMGD